MKIKLFGILIFLFTAQGLLAQSKLSPAEKKMNDALCDCISKIDQSKIKDAKEAEAAFMECFAANADLLIAVAEEKDVSLSDDEATTILGEQIGKNLLTEKCTAFMKLAMLMEDDSEAVEQTTGVFKRMDNKGFNYIVITANNNESSFLWLRPFPNSDRFIEGGSNLAGKKMQISWREIEVYLPAVKGYYKMKEITGIQIL